MSTQLILIRHGETDKNINNIVHPQEDKLSINKNGVLQVKKTAQALIEYQPSIIYSSYEKRSNDSAKIIKNQLNIPIKLLKGIQERNWGKLSNKSWSEINAILKPMSLGERYTYTPPSGESWKETETRLVKTISKILKKHKGQTVVVVTHAGAIRILMPYLLNKPKEESFNHNPDNASITIFKQSGSRFNKVIINDTSHLSR